MLRRQRHHFRWIEAGRDIDPVTENVWAVCNDFAEIDANAEFYAPIRWHLRISLEHTLLNRDGAANCVDDANEFRNVLSPAALAIRPRCDFIKVWKDCTDDPLIGRAAPSSSAPIKRLYPATSAARIAAR